MAATMPAPPANYTGPVNFMGMPLPNPDEVGIGADVLGVTWLFTSLAIIVVGLRAYTRQRFLKRWTVEDWLMYSALVMHIVDQALITVCCRYGLGKEFENMTMDDSRIVQKLEFVAAFFAYMTSMLSRISIAMLLVRIFGVARPGFKWFVIGMTTIISITAVLCIVFKFVQTKPVEAFWDVRIKGTKMLPKNTEPITALVFQFLLMLSDFLLCVLPVAFVWNVQMPKRRKVGLVLLFSVSILTTGIMAGKIGLILQIFMGGIRRWLGMYTAVFFIIEFVEHCIVIIVGSVPTLGPLSQLDVAGYVSRSFSKLKLTGSWRSRGSSKGNNSGSPGDSIYKGWDPEMGQAGRGPNEKRSDDGVVHVVRDELGRVVRLDEISILQSTRAESTFSGSRTRH